MGLFWNTRTDTLYYRPPQDSPNKKFTKRSIILFISELFDPLGLLGPIIIIGKIIMQNLWQQKIDWDEAAPHHIRNHFLEYKKSCQNWKDYKFYGELYQLNIIQL